MTFREIFKIAFIFFFILISCSEPKYSKETKYSNETKYFENYLIKNFNKKYPENKGYFFIIPNNGCFGCRKTVLKFILSKDFNQQNYFGIISQPEDEVLKLVKNMKNVFIDEKGRIDRLKILTENTVMIVTEKKIIKNIIPLTAQNVDSIRQYIHIY